MHFSVRTVFQSEHILNIFNMVISGLKTHSYTKCIKSIYGWMSWIANTKINLFTVFKKKWIFAILIHIHLTWRIHSAGDILIHPIHCVPSKSGPHVDLHCNKINVFLRKVTATAVKTIFYYKIILSFF